MSAISVSLSVPTDQVEDLQSALLFLTPPEQPPALTSFVDDATGRWTVTAYFTPAPDAKELEDALAPFLAAPIGNGDLAITPIPDVDWTAEALRHHRPVWEAPYYVHGSHHPPRPGRFNIHINGAMAFGTGQHATTQGCLRALACLRKRTGQMSHILDVGTGTGILALAARRTWPGLLVASDLDPVAVGVASDNARQNHVHRQSGWHTVVAAGVSHPVLRAHAPYDLVFANILAQPLIALAAAFAGLIKPDGHIVLSGLLADQEKEVFAAYRNRGFVLDRRFPIGTWMTLLLKKA